MTEAEARLMIARCVADIVGDAALQALGLNDDTHLAYDLGLESLEIIGLIEALAAQDVRLLERLDLSTDGMRDLTMGTLLAALCAAPDASDG